MNSNTTPSRLNEDPYAEGPPCQTKGCGHEWFEHSVSDPDGDDDDLWEHHRCQYCPCTGYREEPLERDEAEPYDY